MWARLYSRRDSRFGRVLLRDRQDWSHRRDEEARRRGSNAPWREWDRWDPREGRSRSENPWTRPSGDWDERARARWREAAGLGFQDADRDYESGDRWNSYDSWRDQDEARYSRPEERQRPRQDEWDSGRPWDGERQRHFDRQWEIDRGAWSGSGPQARANEDDPLGEERDARRWQDGGRGRWRDDERDRVPRYSRSIRGSDPESFSPVATSRPRYLRSSPGYRTGSDSGGTFAWGWGSGSGAYGGQEGRKFTSGYTGTRAGHAGRDEDFYPGTRTGQVGREEDFRGGYAGRGPRGYRRSDERIREDLADRLTEHPAIDASEIDITVDGCAITLSGQVESRYEKRLAEDLAESVSGAIDVQNRLRVQPRDGGEGQRWASQSSAGGWQYDRHEYDGQSGSGGALGGTATSASVGGSAIGAKAQHKDRIKAGMKVAAFGGEESGEVKSLRESDFVVHRRLKHDICIPFDAVANVEGERIVLSTREDMIDKMDWPTPGDAGNTSRATR